MNEHKERPTVGSLFAGIGGFDLGFERAGFATAWQVEINPINRAVLGDRFPHARQFEDVNRVGKRELCPVDVLLAGFPCQDISNAGSSRKGDRPGLQGPRSGLFYQVLRILDELRPAWVVLENVPALLHSNNSEDIQIVIASLAECGYLGCFRVLDAAHFGSPCRRRRLFLVGRLGQQPPLELLSDAAPVEGIPSSFGKIGKPQGALDWPGNTLLASNSPARITLGSELLVAEPDRWGAMVERQRETEDHGVPAGLDDSAWAEVYAAGNAVAVPCAQWIAEKIRKAF